MLFHVVYHDLMLMIKILKFLLTYEFDSIKMAMQFNKPRFDWEAKDRLSELEQFKQECSVLFQGPLSEMKDTQKAGLIVNWIGLPMHNDPSLHRSGVRQAQNCI